MMSSTTMQAPPGMTIVVGCGGSNNFGGQSVHSYDLGNNNKPTLDSSQRIVQNITNNNSQPIRQQGFLQN